MKGYIDLHGDKPTGEACRGCAYSFEMAGSCGCQYILVTGRRRPCPAGEGCTERRETLQREELRRVAASQRPPIPGRPMSEEALDAWAARNK